MTAQLKDDVGHIRFVEQLIDSYALTAKEKLNYESYLKALRGGFLEMHQGRYVYIVNGKLLRRSFKLAHEIVDHLTFVVDHDTAEPDEHQHPGDLLFSDSTFIYVPTAIPSRRR